MGNDSLLQSSKLSLKSRHRERFAGRADKTEQSIQKMKVKLTA